MKTESSTKISLRISETRQRINKLQSRDDALTEAETRERDDLSGKLDTAETEYRAAVEHEEAEKTVTKTTDPEHRARLELRGRTGFADYISAALGGVEVRGAAAEYAQSLGVPLFGKMPVDLFGAFLPPPLETRAVTGGPTVDGTVQTAIQFVFKRTVAAGLGVQFVSHAQGQASIPRVTTAPPADTLAKDGNAPDSAAVITLDHKDPERVAGQFSVRVEDLAVYPALEQTLMESIRRSISNEVDKELIGDLFTAAADVTAESSTVTFASGMALFASLVDGEHANSYGDVRAIIGSKTFASFDSKYQSNGDMSLADKLAVKLGSLVVSNRVPAGSATTQKSLVTLGASGDPIRTFVWNALDVVRDVYSNARSGQVLLTATALMSSPHVPHGTAMLKEVHPKIS